MKLYQKIILIIFILISVGFNIKHIFWPYDFKTQAEMTTAAEQISDITSDKFEQICNKIIENYKTDNKFVTAFIADKEEFLKYRTMQINTVLPAYNSDFTAYGTNYPIYAGSYRNELTINKIKEYKRAVETYCLYNDIYQPAGACSEETIDNLFK